MKSLIMFTMVASVLRAVLDVVFSFFTIPGYQILRQAIYTNDASHWQQFYWYYWYLIWRLTDLTGLCIRLDFSWCAIWFQQDFCWWTLAQLSQKAILSIL